MLFKIRISKRGSQVSVLLFGGPNLNRTMQQRIIDFRRDGDPERFAKLLSKLKIKHKTDDIQEHTAKKFSWWNLIPFNGATSVRRYVSKKELGQRLQQDNAVIDSTFSAHGFMSALELFDTLRNF